MSRKKKLLSTTILLLLFALLAAILAFNTIPPPAEGITDTSQSVETPEGPLFVVPENPLGVIGLITALAAGLGVVSAKQRKRK